MMTRHSAAIVLVLLGALLHAQQQTTVAEIAGARITHEQFGWWLESIRAGGDQARALQSVTADGQKRLLEELVTDRLFAEAARAQGLDRAPAVAFVQDQQAARALAAQFERAVASRIAETDLRAFYDANIDRFRPSRRVKARHILTASREEAERARDEVRGGAAFEDVARRRSTDSRTAASGGDLGWITTGIMVADVERALFALETRAISDVVQSNFGFHVLKVDEVDPGAALPYDAVRDVVRQGAVAERLAAERARLAVAHKARTYPHVLGGGPR